MTKIITCSTAVGMFILLGVAGSDCGGTCIEDSMSISEMLSWSLVGVVLMAWPLMPWTLVDKK
jgi:hypothetical protein